MNPRPKYKTKQRDQLLAYLETVPGRHVTAGDVCEAFRRDGAPIGQSTVYRQLESLVGEGILNKYIVDEKSPACFEYVRPESHGTGTCIVKSWRKSGVICSVNTAFVWTPDERCSTDFVRPAGKKDEGRHPPYPVSPCRGDSRIARCGRRKN